MKYTLFFHKDFASPAAFAVFLAPPPPFNYCVTSHQLGGVAKKINPDFLLRLQICQNSNVTLFQHQRFSLSGGYVADENTLGPLHTHMKAGRSTLYVAGWRFIDILKLH